VSRSALAVLSVVVAVLVAGCAGIEPDAQGLPAGSELVATSGSAMRAVTSAHFDLVVHGTVPGVLIRSARGDVDARGTARGSADVARTGSVDFVLVKGVFYVKGSTGGYRKAPPGGAGDVFALTSILNPNHGSARAVIGVNGATTQDRETVNGVACFRITGTIGVNSAAGLVPGIRTDVRATVWLAASGTHLPVRVEFTALRPAPGGNGTVDVSFSNVNTPVSVDAPV
jgi:hypothetical protein